MKSQGKVRGFRNFQKKVASQQAPGNFSFHELLAILEKRIFLNINCKQFMFRNIPFLIFMVSDFSLKIKSASINICKKNLVLSMDENG